MASLTTYLMVSGVDAPRDLEDHPDLAPHDLEVRDVTDAEDTVPQVTFVHESGRRIRTHRWSSASSKNGSTRSNG